MIVETTTPENKRFRTFQKVMKSANEYLLNCLSEECAEVIQQNGKIERFGIDDIYTHIADDRTETKKPEMGTNRERLIKELNDIIAITEMLVARGVLPEHWESTQMKEAKKLRIIKYSEYSVKVGVLAFPLTASPVYAVPQSSL